MASTVRKAANLSLDADLVAQARDLNINISRAAESGISAAVKAERERQWRLENAEAIKAYNDYVAKNGLPLERYRSF